ncbi:hypothetical protein [Nocardioides mangrovi]|uniref:Uncharacterized protein n=1 Tax=Nocardioides mangrovi TaxID=2874580 RepID=A0ABS7U9K7_9ACTN|nr:hypothetical protein [Nocardioides mangrovi]MBZ5737666.1 hypothetical protein [Nocardioides mangrovi]
MGARTRGDGVEIGIRRRGAAAVEVVRAVPVRAVASGGLYELRGNSFHVPLAVRDLVRARPDGTGLRLTGLVCPGPLTLAWASLVPAHPPQTDVLMDGWLRRGATWSELRGRRVAMVWQPGVAARDVRRLLADDLASGHLQDLEVHEPDDRTDEALADCAG